MIIVSDTSPINYLVLIGEVPKRKASQLLGHWYSGEGLAPGTVTLGGCR
jgi:hypothetical protein